MRPGTVEFHRPARVLPAPTPRSTVGIAGPPVVPEPSAGAAWHVLAPVLGSAGLIGFAVMMGEPRYVLMAGLVGGAMLVSGVVSRVVATRSANLRRSGTAERYRAHLDDVRARLEGAASQHRSAAAHANPSPLELGELIADRTRVWERRPSDTDFLAVRLGTGTIEAPLSPKLDRPTDPMSLPEPDLAAEAAALESETSHIPDVPIAVDLEDKGCVAIVGEPVSARALAAGVIAQLAALRSPSELAVAGYVAPEAEPDWRWVKWLPHSRRSPSNRDDGATHLTTEVSDLDDWLRGVAGGRGDAIGSGSGDPRARRTVLLLDGYAPATDIGRLDNLEWILSSARDLGMLVLAIVERREHMPGATAASVTIEDRGTLTYREMRSEGARISGIIPDPFDRAGGEEIARALAPLRDRPTGDTGDLGVAGLLDLLGTRPEHFEPERRRRDDSAGLRTPIGLDRHGDPLVLDIREPALGGMGPHGMLIGATGSGKSELLRTLVLGLATENSPDDLSLVLADFKGGATFAGLEALPHTAGSISNLESDPTLIDRMQEALFGELERRQRLLRAAGVDRADEYRRRRSLAAGRELEAMPALLVVVDEFGELLTARPDFADLFTSIGRTGRSLGVHLLLSSQRLDEGRIRRIEGHLRYRICLRTFSPEESQAVIGSRASFDLPAVPGVGHLAVDSELIRFRAGLVNRPVQTAGGSRPAGVRRFDISGPSAPIGSAPPESPDEPAPVSEMELVIGRLRSLGPRARQVWLAPLPERLGFDPSPSPVPLGVAVGTCDLPRRQETPRSVLDFSGSAGNLAVVGGPRSGKSTTLATIVGAFAAGHSPETVAFHGIDLGGGLLHRLEALPHVGSVFGRSHREEIPRLVRHLHALVQRRAGASHSQWTEPADGRGQAEASDGAHVFLVIDNWGLFSQEFGPELTDLVADILATGLHHGVHVIISAGRWQDIRLSLRDHIGGRFELRLTDPVESEIDRHAARALPVNVPGRAIDGLGRLTQVMCPPDDLAPIIERWATAVGVPPVRMLPRTVTEEDLANGAGIGLSEHGPDTWGPDLFGPHPHFVILGDTESGKTTSLRGLIRSLHHHDDVAIGVIDYRRRLDGEVAGARRLGHASSPEQAHALTDRILGELPESPFGDRHRRTRKAWILVIDDYDLVAGASANPVGRLADVVPRGRDLNFHLVVARRVAGMSRASFDPLIQRLREMGTPTLLLDGDPGEGPVAGPVRASRQPPGRGLVVSRSRSTLVQVARFEPIAHVHALAREETA